MKTTAIILASIGMLTENITIALICLAICLILIFKEK